MDIKFEIVEELGVFSENEKGWTKEVNLIAWNDRDPKVDIRNWNEDKSKNSKIGTMTLTEAKKLGKILSNL